LRPLDVFSGLLVRPKCIRGQGFVPKRAGGAYSAPPGSIAGGEGLTTPSPRTPSPLSAVSLESPPRQYFSNSQVIGCEDRLQNDLYCVGWGVKLYSIQSHQGKFLAMPMGSASNQNCCKGSASKKRLKNTGLTHYQNLPLVPSPDLHLVSGRTSQHI